jgi:hypothetical protein
MSDDGAELAAYALGKSQHTYPLKKSQPQLQRAGIPTSHAARVAFVRGWHDGQKKDK